mmetsp:Transcript_31722/g.109702  ORF Transcript_31722/g.109702 Transcript_31722/m.109702 type:complete len:326 (-) Transcript_31722:2-979(-)
MLAGYVTIIADTMGKNARRSQLAKFGERGICRTAPADEPIGAPNAARVTPRPKPRNVKSSRTARAADPASDRPLATCASLGCSAPLVRWPKPDGTAGAGAAPGATGATTRIHLLRRTLSTLSRRACESSVPRSCAACAYDQPSPSQAPERSSIHSVAQTQPAGAASRSAGGTSAPKASTEAECAQALRWPLVAAEARTWSSKTSTKPGWAAALGCAEGLSAAGCFAAAPSSARATTTANERMAGLCAALPEWSAYTTCEWSSYKPCEASPEVREVSLSPLSADSRSAAPGPGLRRHPDSRSCDVRSSRPRRVNLRRPVATSSPCS